MALFVKIELIDVAMVFVRKYDRSTYLFKMIMSQLFTISKNI